MTVKLSRQNSKVVKSLAEFRNKSASEIVDAIISAEIKKNSEFYHMVQDLVEEGVKDGSNS